ncbi:hypothetical protein LTR98_010562 [Exophiala xenobiotica]|uniref:Uncharacterized protein n=1 Tax=Vermiconidia calcicola TaxID=1690605 RepID=A0AAV9PS53_9PEZI|nr:hypothetical protein LTR98_010562 [Exophiala xenobiotica]KAK5528256.1 hypothetical protein LTR25_010563 [Vermiconidia calcicola]KAK5534146.1 hypothetical protein LTR23_008939 [Chaetothyriales sp. CCFEE 6169]
MGAVLGMAVLAAGLGSVDFGEAQNAWHLEDVLAFQRLEVLIQDDGPGGDDPGRQFVLEVRRTNTLPDDQMKAYMLMIRPSLTPEQLAHALRPFKVFS